MTSEEVRKAISTAIQMEMDGHAFYTNAAAQTTSESGRSIFEGLAKDEKLHLQAFKDIFSDSIGAEDYGKLVESSKKYARLNVFPTDLKPGSREGPNENDLDALTTAMKSEKDAIDYYTGILNQTVDANVAKILKEIIHQEKQHYFILEEEINYLGRTGQWYDVELLTQEY